jgi:hypothetical protein
MPDPTHCPTGIDYDSILKSLEQDDAAPALSTNDLLRELIDEVRGMRRDMKASERRRGIATVPGVDRSSK